MMKGSSFTVRVEKVKNDDLGEFCEKIIQRARIMESLHGEDNLVAPDVAYHAGDLWSKW